ncbi:MAG: hypothetical protein KF773_02250 [Deltaproteobacteria bacterium]|nr:hypothetical protein [Deltaproteobacteria bacterium]
MWRACSAAWCALAACYAPSPPSGAPCSAARDCPAGLVCTATPGGERCLPADGTAADASPPGGDGAAPPADGPSGACTPKVLLDGTVPPMAQGWELVQAGSLTLTTGSTGTTLTTTGGTTRALLVLRNAVPTSAAFTLDFTVQVVASGGHAPGEAAVALMASFHDPTGDSADRARMVYLDKEAVGWGDAGLTVGLDTTQLRTYRLALQANGALRFSLLDGSLSIGGGAFVTNGTIAIGDQSSAMGLDASIHIVSVVRGCP